MPGFVRRARAGCRASSARTGLGLVPTPADSDGGCAPRRRKKAGAGAAKPADKQAKCKARRGSGSAPRRRRRSCNRRRRPADVVRASFNGDLDRRIKLAEATLGEGAVTTGCRRAGQGRELTSNCGKVASSLHQRKSSQAVAGGAPPCQARARQETPGRRKEGERSANRGEGRGTTLKKAGKETASHSKLAKKRSSKKK